jgi:nicotinate-nucleotide adenylyltransferase
MNGSKPLRVGLLGGTFDPIHYTHLHMAEVAKSECGLDEIWFVPAKVPPHKQDRFLSSAQARLDMLRLAIEPVSYFKLCLAEFEREGPSYTIDTVESLQAAYPNHQFYFIIGEDLLATLREWHRIDELCHRITFIVLTRPGFSQEQLTEWEPYIKRVSMIPSHLSSTLIRQRVREGKSIRFLVPDQVYDYIDQKKLYAQYNSN